MRTMQKDGYIVEPLTVGWFCPDKVKCGIFNTDEKEFLVECRACRTPRPKVEDDSLKTTQKESS